MTAVGSGTVYPPAGESVRGLPEGGSRSSSGWGRFWPWAAAALSGGLLALCFPPANLWWLCWVALTPLIAAIWFGCARGNLRPALLGYVAGLVFFWGAFYWLTTVTAPGWFALAFYLALYFAFWGWFIGVVARPVSAAPEGCLPPLLRSRHNLRIGLLGAAAWVTQEAARGIVFTGFGWNGPGVALYRQLPFIQIADLTGVAGLSFLVVLCNLMIVLTIWRLVLEVGKVRLRPHWDYSLTLVAVLGVFLYGVRQMQTRPESRPLRVVSVQANIPQNQKFDAAFEQRIFDTYQRLTEAAADLDPDLVLWPEAATPRAMYGDRTNFDFVVSMAKLGEYAFLLGTIDFDEEKDFNVAILLQRGAVPQVYRKIHLVPFGEYIPFRHTFPLFAMIAGDLVPGDFTPGTEHTVFRINGSGVRLAPLICFEDTLGDLTRQFVLNGAEALVTITNDGWFLRSAGNEQHLANSVFRAVENRRPLLRSANTGITAFIGTHGEVLQTLRDQTGSPFFEGLLFGEVQVPKDGPLTFYTRRGEVFAIAMSVVTGLAIIVYFVRRRQAG